ncbi:hypothetical protein PtoMrB4_44380 [Metapseudomonas otitidis]|uniref:Uncharacterized protein n=2 Tax=Metapseudomonas otitidis TaxID=319939 RepID=A0A679GGW1_9GAMM|nr:hypothetical protein PtoMrB4_44380 [Pseudomonas otitidis]
MEENYLVLMSCRKARSPEPGARSPEPGARSPHRAATSLLLRLLRIIRFDLHRDPNAAAMRFRQLVLLFHVAGFVDDLQVSRLNKLGDNALYYGLRAALHRARADFWTRHRSESVKDS